MGRKQKEKTYIKSIRVNQDTKEFLESLENANLFFLKESYSLSSVPNQNLDNQTNKT